VQAAAASRPRLLVLAGRGHDAESPPVNHGLAACACRGRARCVASCPRDLFGLFAHPERLKQGGCSGWRAAFGQVLSLSRWVCHAPRSAVPAVTLAGCCWAGERRGNCWPSLLAERNSSLQVLVQRTQAVREGVGADDSVASACQGACAAAGPPRAAQLSHTADSSKGKGCKQDSCQEPALAHRPPAQKCRQLQLSGLAWRCDTRNVESSVRGMLLAGSNTEGGDKLYKTVIKRGPST
jgi:hypothetical protein